MTKCRKRPFMCCALDTTEEKEGEIVVGAVMITAIDKDEARQVFTINNAEALSPVAGNVEICVTPFCRE